MSVLSSVSKQLNEKCLAECCCDSDCCLSLVNLDASMYVLIYLEVPDSPIPQDVPHCDYLFIGYRPECSSIWVVPVELSTGRNKRLGQFIEQLEAGAALADRLMPSDSDIDVRFVPVAAAPFSVGRIRALRRDFAPITFRTFKSSPFVLDCGDSLIDALT